MVWYSHLCKNFPQFVVIHNRLVPGEFHGHRSLTGYSPWGGHKSDGHNWATNTFTLPNGESKLSSIRVVSPPYLRLLLSLLAFLIPACESSSLAFCIRNSEYKLNKQGEISSLSHSIVFLYFSALITEEGFLIFPCYSLELCIHMGIIFPFLLCL